MKEEEENIQPRQQRRVGNHWASQPEKGTVGRTSKWSPATQQTPQSHNPGPFSLLAKSFVNAVPQFTKDSDKGCTPHDEYWRERRNTCIYIIYIYTDIRFGGIFENLCKNTLVFYGTGIIQDKLLHKVGNSRQGVTVQSNRRASLHPGHSVTAKCPSRSLLFLIEEDDGLRWSVIPVQQTSKKHDCWHYGNRSENSMTAGIVGTDQITNTEWTFQNSFTEDSYRSFHYNIVNPRAWTINLSPPLPSPPLPSPHSPSIFFGEEWLLRCFSPSVNWPWPSSARCTPSESSAETKSDMKSDPNENTQQITITHISNPNTAHFIIISPKCRLQPSL